MQWISPKTYFPPSLLGLLHTITHTEETPAQRVQIPQGAHSFYAKRANPRDQHTTVDRKYIVAQK